MYTLFSIDYAIVRIRVGYAVCDVCLDPQQPMDFKPLEIADTPLENRLQRGAWSKVGGV